MRLVPRAACRDWTVFVKNNAAAEHRGGVVFLFSLTVSVFFHKWLAKCL